MFQRLFIFTCLLVLLLVSGTSYAARCYVSADGQASANGLSWASSTTLHQALATPNCTVIWVKSGVYYPVSPADPANVTDEERAKYFLVDRPLLLLGGFNGTETAVTQRDLDVNAPTILSGDIDKNDANADGNRINETSYQIAGSNSNLVLFVHQKPDSTVSFTDTNSILNGVTVTGAARHSGILLAGQGASNTKFAPRLSRLVIQGNQFLSRQGLPVDGFFSYAGGLNFLLDRPSLMGNGAQFFRVHVEGNHPGGIHMRAVPHTIDVPPLNKMISFDSSTVINNRSDAGSMSGMTVLLPTLVSHSRFEGNFVNSGTAALAGYSKLVIKNSQFINQSSVPETVHNTNFSATVRHHSEKTGQGLSIIDSEFKDNHTSTAISSFNKSSAAFLSNVNIHNNLIGVASFGGDMHIKNSSIHHNRNSGIIIGSIVGNNADVSQLSSVHVEASTILNNESYRGLDALTGSARFFGDGIDVGYKRSLKLTDTTIWNDSVQNNHGESVAFKRSVLFDCYSRGNKILEDMGGNAYYSPNRCNKSAPSSITFTSPSLTWDASVPSNPVLMPATNSQLIDATPCPTEATKDQRGVARPQGSQCDIGAVERRFGTKTLTVTIAPDSIGKGNVSAQPSTASGSGTIENCTNECSAQYDGESMVPQITLMANPTSPNKTFWSGDCVVTGNRNQALVSIDKPTMQCTVAFKTADNPVDPPPVDPPPVEGLVFKNGFE